MWSEAFTERARAYWTDARTRELIGDKPLLLLPAQAAPLLRVLGLLHRDASMPPAQVRKFRQINHMLLLLEQSLQDFRGKPFTIVDAACGGSYLTLMLAWLYREATIVGVDRNEALLRKCARHAELLGLNVRYEASLVSQYQGRGDVLVSLHACDTASDDAIALGVRMGASLIAVAPCCQAELAAKARGGPLGRVWESPQLARQMGSTLTDAMRMMLLRTAGYHATVLELVPTEHTPKNSLIRARLTGERSDWAEYLALKTTAGAGIKLETLLTSPNAG